MSKKTAKTTAKKVRISTKTILRGLYKNKKAAFTLKELCAKCDTVKPNTVETAIIDLKNPKWSVGPVLVLVKNAKQKYVVAK
jgi:hypothetical protein